jgi:hypothetical protein
MGSPLKKRAILMHALSVRHISANNDGPLKRQARAGRYFGIAHAYHVMTCDTLNGKFSDIGAWVLSLSR